MMSIIYTCLCMLALSAAVVDGAVGVVEAIGGATALINLLTNAGGFLPTHRQCTIRIQNLCTSHTLTNPNMYIQSGSSSIALPHDIGPNRETVVQFVKTPHAAKGAVGVFTYDMKDAGSGRSARTFTFMFAVPYDFTFHSSWYAVGLRDSSYAMPCDYDLYYIMYYANRGWFHRRSADSDITYTDARYTVKASMTNTFTPTIVVTFYD